MKINEARDLLVYMMKQAIAGHEPVTCHFKSGPGLGKTSIHYQAADIVSKEIGEPVGVKVLQLSRYEALDVNGIYLPGKDKDGSLMVQATKPAWMPGVDEPRFGIVFLDEYMQASLDTRKATSSLALDRCTDFHRLPPGWITSMASNREQDRSGVGKSIAMLDNRVAEIQVEPDLDAFSDWAERNDVHPLAVAFAKFKPGTVFKDEVPAQPGPFCTPRSLVRLSKHIGNLSSHMFLQFAKGMIGEGAAVEFVAFLRVAEELPSFEEIVAKPDQTPVPQKIDAQYAAMQMLAHRVTGKTAAAAFKYLSRMPKEFQVAGLQTSMRKTPQIVQVPEFADWLRKNKDLIIAANLSAK